MAKKSKKSKSDNIVGSDNLKEAIASIYKEFGEESIHIGDASYIDVESVTTGIPMLDIALGCRGIPRGRIIELYGSESGGKTTTAYNIMASYQRTMIDDKLGVVALIDAEHSMDAEWAMHNGVDMERLILSQPDSGEQAFSIIDTLVQHNAVDLIVVDSVAAMTPKVEIEGKIGDVNIGAQARMMSQSLRKLIGKCLKTKTTILFINQLREKIGFIAWGSSPESTPGGRALKFYSSVRMDVRKSTKIKDGDNIIGMNTRIKIVKNKVAPPFKQAIFAIYFGDEKQEPEVLYGVDPVESLLDAAILYNVVTVSGSFYKFDGSGIGQGKSKVACMIRDNADLFKKIHDKVYNIINKTDKGIELPDADEILEDIGNVTEQV